ncbi:glycosyltransferase family 2 protein [Anaerobacterium chartisolvens]|nr:glycosyltransferase family 2 protein [Anaerobacterium chartisolvens]
MKVLIIIPAYNEEKSLPGLLKGISQNCPQYDVLVVNDCSSDNTSAVCRACGVKVVDLPVNLGIGGAVQAGYRYALYNGYDAAVQVDGDGQHNPEYIGELVSQLEKGSNLCIGSRFIEKEGFQSTFSRRVGIKYFCTLIKLITGRNMTDPTSGFRACDRKAIEYFSRDYPRDYPEPETLVSANRNKLIISEIPVIMNERKGGKSSITSLKSVYYMIKVSLAVITAAISKGGR